MKFFLSTTFFLMFDSIPTTTSLICNTCAPQMTGTGTHTCKTDTCDVFSTECYYSQIQTSPGNENSTIFWSGCHEPSTSDYFEMENCCTPENYFEVCNGDSCNDNRFSRFADFPARIDQRDFDYELRKNQLNLKFRNLARCNLFWYTVRYFDTNRPDSVFTEKMYTDSNMGSRQTMILRHLTTDSKYQVSIITHSTYSSNTYQSQPFNFIVTVPGKVSKRFSSEFNLLNPDNTIRPNLRSKFCAVQFNSNQLFWARCNSDFNKYFVGVQKKDENNVVFLKTVKGDLCWTVNEYAAEDQIVELQNCVFDKSQEFILEGDRIIVNGGVTAASGFCVKFEPGNVVYTREC